MSFAEFVSPLLGRMLLSWFFITQAVQRIHEWNAMTTLFRIRHLPFGPLLLVVAVIAMVVGGIALLIGFQTQFSALLLFVCTIGWIEFIHDFWALSDPAARAADYQIFALGVAVAGGLLVLVGLGGGSCSIDNIQRRKRRA